MSDQLNRIEHLVLDSGIHKFVFHDAARESAYQYIAHFKALYADLPPDTTLRLLLDFSNTSMPPFKAFAEALQGFRQRPDVRQRIAHIYNDILFPTVMKNLVIHAGLESEQHERRFFQAHQEAEALAWLLGDD